MATYSTTTTATFLGDPNNPNYYLGAQINPIDWKWASGTTTVMGSTGTMTMKEVVDPVKAAIDRCVKECQQ